MSVSPNISDKDTYVRRMLCDGFRSVLVLLLLTSCRSMLHAQSVQTHQDQASQEANTQIQSLSNGKGYTLHVTAREVVVEVVARDHQNHPVNDLAQSEFEIFEGKHKSDDGLKAISGFRVIDPLLESSPHDTFSRSVVLPLGGRCEIRSTVHYEIAFHPGNWKAGYHFMVVTTTRRHVTLSYRAQYYVGVEDIDASTTHRSARGVDIDLMDAACFHPDIPASILLDAKKIESQNLSQLRYSIKVLPDSLKSAGIEEESPHVQLDYGVCTFSKSGRMLGYWNFAEDRSLKSSDIDAVLSNGWNEFMDVPLKNNPTLARFVVLEPKSGNLGTIDLSINVHTASDEPEDSEEKAPTRVLTISEDPDFSKERNASLGSLVPRSNTLCGDVYELPNTTSFLPSDFRVLNAVGAVYTHSLNVPEQILHQGIPGSTPRSEWFGIDYYGQFWVTKPGQYLFVLNADDGADLYIDDHILISDDGIHPPRTVSKSIMLNTGRHTIHLPYFQGPTYVNLILQIKPPDEDLKVFNLSDFSDPSKRKDSRP
jgi:hypothetical protein